MNQLEKIQNPLDSASGFSHAMDVANQFAKSDLVPQAFRGKPANVVIAIEMAFRMGASPMMVMQNSHIIMGKFSWSSTFLIACVNKCGLFSSLRFEKSEANGGSCRAYATEKLTNEIIYGVWVSMDMAKAEGWTTKKGSKWVTMPELMMNYRAAAFFQRQHAPEISMGFHTTEEVVDMGASLDGNGNTNIGVKSDELYDEISDANSIDQLEGILQDNRADITKEPKLMSLFKGKLKEYLISDMRECKKVDDLADIETRFLVFITKDFSLTEELGKAKKRLEI